MSMQTVSGYLVHSSHAFVTRDELTVTTQGIMGHDETTEDTSKCRTIEAWSLLLGPMAAASQCAHATHTQTRPVVMLGDINHQSA